MLRAKMCLSVSGSQTGRRNLPFSSNMPKKKKIPKKGENPSDNTRRRRNANRRQNETMALSTAFSTNGCYSDISSVTYNSVKTEPVEEAIQRAKNVVISAISGHTNHAELTIVRSVSITSMTEKLVFCSPNLEMNMSPMFHCVMRSGYGTAKMSFQRNTPFSRVLSNHFRGITSLHEPSPSWRRDGYPLWFFTHLSGSGWGRLITGSGAGQFSIKVTFAYLRDDRYENIPPVLSCLPDSSFLTEFAKTGKTMPGAPEPGKPAPAARAAR